MWPSLYGNYSNILEWKLQLDVSSYFGVSTIKGSTSMVFKLNRVPLGGNCYANIYNATALYDIVTFYFDGWTDLDVITGDYIAKYVLTRKSIPIFSVQYKRIFAELQSLQVFQN